jgi:hypothetical protein
MTGLMCQVEDVGVESKVEDEKHEKPAQNKEDHVIGKVVGHLSFASLVVGADAEDGTEDDCLGAGRIVGRAFPTFSIGAYVV